jgi:cysteine desulfurase
LYFENAKEKNHIVTTTIEHPAVIESVSFLKKYFGVEVDLVKPNSNGEINIEEIKGRIKKNTFLVSLMHSNNETGIINDIEELSKFTKEKNIPFLSDTVQSIGKADLKFSKLGIDFITSSAHKIYGPKGIGFLVANPKFKFTRYSDGGGQERELRAGTENIPLIAGFRKAIEIIKLNFDKELEHYNLMSSYLIEQLHQNFGEGAIINFRSKKNLPNIVNVTFDPDKYGFPPDMFLILLDMQGIAVSGGSACSSGSLKPSKILTEIGKSEKEALSSIRISIGRFNDKNNIDVLIKGLRNVLRLN